jgi:hypothetical protein
MCRFIKFIPSEEATFLIRKHPKAFVLLTIIAQRARRESGHPDGLTIGQCHIGDWENMGFTRQEYRTALNILIVKKFIEKVETCRTRKKSTTGATTIGTLVKLSDNRIYDINLNESNHHINHRPTTGQPPANHDQERRRMNKNDHHPQTPSSPKKMMTDDFSSIQKIEIYPGVFLSQSDLDLCIKIKGDMEKLKQSIEFIQNSPRRKSEITDWPNALSRWKIENKSKNRIEENLAFAEKLSKTFSEFKDGNGWRCYIYLDKKKDQRGLLFQSQSAYKEALFIPFVDGEFQQKCHNIITNNKMRKECIHLIS